MKEIPWKAIDSGADTAKFNMAFDEQLLKNIDPESCQPILHLYEWNAPSATYGYFTDPYTLLNASTVEQSGLQLARRPTGGGIIFHLTDFAFSILVPAGHSAYSINVLDNYAFVNRMLVEIIEKFSGGKIGCRLLPEEPTAIDSHSGYFCMAKPTKYDVVLDDGRKVAGGAQRRTKNGFLHQGTISLGFPNEYLLESVLLPGTRVLEAMRLNTYPLLGNDATVSAIVEAKQVLRNLFLTQIQ